jgi:hypothetical protein
VIPGSDGCLLVLMIFIQFSVSLKINRKINRKTNRFHICRGKLTKVYKSFIFDLFYRIPIDSLVIEKFWPSHVLPKRRPRGLQNLSGKIPFTHAKSLTRGSSKIKVFVLGGPKGSDLYGFCDSRAGWMFIGFDDFYTI